MRDELLNETLFHGLAHAGAAIAEWVADYNTEWPHAALGYQTPASFAEQLINATDRRAAPSTSSTQRSVAQPAPRGVSTKRTLAPPG